MPFVLIVVAIISSLVLGKEVKDFVQHPSVQPASTETPAFSPIPSPTPTPSPYNQTQNTTPTREPEPQVQQQTQSSSVIDCIGPDGKHLQLTQKACDNFNAAWDNSKYTNQNNQSAPPSNQSTVPAQSQSGYAGDWVKILCPIPGIPNYIEVGKGYADAQQNCDKLQKSENALSSPYVFQPSSPIPTVNNINNNVSLYNQCVSNAQQTYNAAVQNANVQYGGGSSTGPAIIQIAYMQEQQDITNCGVQYPH